jgi:putative intracellular protease/amidase
MQSATPRKRRILIVLANPAVSSTLGWPVGFWAAELTHAWHEFMEAGYEVEIASPSGGKCELDAYSDPRDASGYSAHDVLSLGFIHHRQLWSRVENTRKLADCRPADFDAIYVAGGQSPMFTFRDNPVLSRAILAFYEAGKPTCVVCHGTAALVDLKLAGGEYLIKGKFMTGFANSEEDFADQVIGKKVMPWRIEDEARKRGANFAAAKAFAPFAVRDGNLITGQQQNSGRKAAQLLIEALGK